MRKNNSKIGAFQLAMITVAFVAGIRGLPVIAEFGSSCIFYYAIAALVFLLPSALVSAELATTWPQRGGVYVWVHEAFNGPWGFLAIWLQFLSNVAYFPAFLAFVGASASYIVMPTLAHNKYFMLCFILIIFWGATFISLRGMRASGWVSTGGVLVGTVIPLIVIVTLASVWLVRGHHTQAHFVLHHIIPNFHKMQWGDMVFLSGLLYSLVGIEASGSHAKDVREVKKNYLRGILISLPFILAVGLGALAIAVVIPGKDLSLVAGNMQAFQVFLGKFKLHWLVPLLAAFIVLGSMGNMVASIIGPSKGLFGSAIGGEIPPFLTKINKNNMPVNMLIYQAVAVSIITLIFLLMPTVSSAYWLIIAIIAIIYLAMYLLMFAAVIRLRYKRPNIERPYKIPGGKLGIWLVAGAGFITCLATMIVGFLPPSQIHIGSIAAYEASVIGGVIVLVGLGILIYLLRKPEWVVKHEM